MIAARGLVVLAAFLVAAAYGAGAAQAADPKLLVFTKTEGHRHDSIPAAIQAVRDLGTRNGFEVTATEDATTFTAAGLAPYDAVLFLLTSGEILDQGQQSAFEAYIRAGHGYVGVHSATDTERGWPWYGRFVGAWSSGHPAEIQPASIDVLTPRDGSTAALPARWTRSDEWYSWQTNPRANGVRVLMTLDEATYKPGEFAMGADHPIAWQHEFEGGRAWYTQLGHTTESYSEPLFLGHLLGGIQYALAKSAGEEKPAKTAGPARITPKFDSVKLTVRKGRVAVVARFRGCKSCAATLRVRSKTVKLKVAKGVASGSSAVLPTGRWQIAVVLTEQKKTASTRVGASATIKRSVRVA